MLKQSMTPETAVAVAAKLAPAALGAAIAVAVGPKTITRREAFARMFVALSCSYLFGDALAIYVETTPYAWLDRTALDGLIGCFGWAAMGGLSALAQRFSRRPQETLRDRF